MQALATLKLSGVFGPAASSIVNQSMFSNPYIDPPHELSVMKEHSKYL